MIITKMSMSRRTVLRGTGAILALPLLDAMVPALSAMANTAANPVRRFGAVYVPNGMAMRYWTPATEGTTFDLSPIMRTLAPFQNQIIVLSGLNGPRGGDHASGSTAFLTGIPNERNGSAQPTRLKVGVSMDQVLAKEFGQHAPLSSLELGLDEVTGSCEPNIPCIYENTISWRGERTPMQMEINPRVVFERMFGDGGTTDPSVRLARFKRDQSILDSVTEAAADFQRNVGPSDRLKIAEYLDAVRDMERRIQTAEAQGVKEVPAMVQPAGIPATFAEHARLMYDLQVLAYQADLTRVTTFMIGRELTGRAYPEIGVANAHHPLSHHLYDPQRILALSKINTYHVTLFAEYLKKLQSTPDGDGSLLDHVIILYGAGMSDSNGHDNDNLPLLVAGGGFRDPQGWASSEVCGRSIAEPVGDADGQTRCAGCGDRRQYRRA